MAKLLCTPEFLVRAIFPDRNDVEVVGLEFDSVNKLIRLDVQGPGVPDAPEVVAVFQLQPPVVSVIKARA